MACAAARAETEIMHTFACRWRECGRRVPTWEHIGSVLQALAIRQHNLLQAARPRGAQRVDVVLPVDVLNAMRHQCLHPRKIVCQALGTMEGMALEELPDPAHGSLVQE